MESISSKLVFWYVDVIVVTSDKDAAQMQNLPKKYGLNINLVCVSKTEKKH